MAVEVYIKDEKNAEVQGPFDESFTKHARGNSRHFVGLAAQYFK